MLSVSRDRAAEAAAEDVADVEVLVEAARATPWAPARVSVVMRYAPFASARICRARSTTGRSIISPSSATAPRPSPLACS